MLETPSRQEVSRYYARARALRAQAFHDLFTLRKLREAMKKRAATKRPVSTSCPC